LLLYGIRPGSGDSGPGFAPALSLKTTVLRVKRVPAGAAPAIRPHGAPSRESTLATLAIGYDDGLPRALSGKGEVLVGGRRAPLVGAISMDLCVADVTDCGEVAPGAEVVVIGSQGQETIGAAELAERAGTIPWEILCGNRETRAARARRRSATVSIACVLPPVKDVSPRLRTKEPPKRRSAARPEPPPADMPVSIPGSGETPEQPEESEPAPEPHEV
jgi:hypothetical protein